MDLSRFRAAPSARLGHLPFDRDRTFPANTCVAAARHTRASWKHSNSKSDNANDSNIIAVMDAITSLFVRKMVTAAGTGANEPALLQSVGLDPDAKVDPKAMVAAPVYYDLLERIAKDIDATDLPLRAGALMRCDDYGALGLAFKAAPTLFGSF